MLTPRALENLTVDNLFTRNRDKGSLAVATNEQISELQGAVSTDAHAKARIEGWWIIRFDVTAIDEVRYHALSETYVTSPIQSVDLSSDRFATLNSIYEFGAAADGAPTLTALMCLSAYFRKTPTGDFFGVPVARF